MFSREQPERREPEARPDPKLEAAKQRHKTLLRRADKAIDAAMQHADEAFGNPYRGPERRHSPR
jgi:hypothetical protein